MILNYVTERLVSLQLMLNYKEEKEWHQRIKDKINPIKLMWFSMRSTAQPRDGTKRGHSYFYSVHVLTCLQKPG